MRHKNTRYRLEQERKKKTVRRFIKRFVLVFLLIIIISLATVQLSRLFSPAVSNILNSFTKEYLTIKEVSILGAGDYSEAEIRSYVEPIVNVNPNILTLPINQIKGFLYTRQYLKKAEIRKEFPARLVLEVVEKRPVAILVQNRFYLLDENGEIIRQMNTGENLDLPLITLDNDLNEKTSKEMIKTACFLLQLDNKSLPLLTPSELRISGGTIILRSLELKNKENLIPPIYFGLDGIEKKILYVKKLWPEIVNKREQIDYIDGRFREGVLVKLKT